MTGRGRAPGSARRWVRRGAELKGNCLKATATSSRPGVTDAALRADAGSGWTVGLGAAPGADVAVRAGTGAKAHPHRGLSAPQPHPQPRPPPSLKSPRQIGGPVQPQLA
ncbi:hypothetical protein Sgleb_20040 [Streptomyces glebosus]|uniref:Uncharacterized protein n=1 Tax=Streptomyces glebosus TaxID=249580 RepID=A0A640SRJ3_9ACTN|nr:hypothetical protein Sgleb_20040 [Streptomyces glebosus]GHG81261.1 hypothetical protein GCM10010513_59680 [Streptomyces glebosus]